MLNVHTMSGKHYKVNDRDEIIRTDMAFTPSGGWIFTGLVPANTHQPWGYDAQSVREALRAGRLDRAAFAFKNGNPRFTVSDIDHGTRRWWGDKVRDVYLSDD